MILHVLSLYMITGNWELLQYFTSIEYYWWHCFSPHRYSVYHWSLHQLCVCRGTTDRPATETLDQEGRGHAVCPQLLTVTHSVCGLWSTCDVFVLHVLVLVDSEGCGLGGDGGHFLTTRMPIVGFLLLLHLVLLILLYTYKKSVIKTWWFLHC